MQNHRAVNGASVGFTGNRSRLNFTIEALKPASLTERKLALLCVVTLVIRLFFATMTGLGIDESYMVASGRQLALSYFDHPPLAWWMAWGGAHLFGTDSELAVRSPFIVCFVVTTCLMYRLTGAMFGKKAGLWAAVALNLSPLFGVTTGSWVLPDGPLMASLLAFAICFRRATLAVGAHHGRWWLAAGFWAGAAMLSKYTAAMVILGGAVYIVTARSQRRWLFRPYPYVAALIALAVFSPVIWWNAHQGWASFLFQGGRARAHCIHWFGPAATVAGETLFLMPWIGVGLLACAISAARRGPQSDQSWFLACLSLPLIVQMACVSVWTHVLFHWAAAGYLFLFPLLGAWAARLTGVASDRLRRVTLVTSILMVAGLVIVGTDVRFNWMPSTIAHIGPITDPALDAVDWRSVRNELAARRLSGRPDLVMGAMRWFIAGKLDYAMDGAARVICLDRDAREYGVVAPASHFAGRDVLIIAPGQSAEEIVEKLRPVFNSIEALPPLTLWHAGRPAMQIPVFLGHHFAGQSV